MKHTYKALVLACTLLPLSTRSDNLENRVQILEAALAHQLSASKPFWKIRSIGDLGGWTWDHKGAITLTATGFICICVIKKLMDDGKVTRDFVEQELDSLNNRLDKEFEQVHNNLALINSNLSHIVPDHQQLPNRRQPNNSRPVNPDSGIISKFMDWIGDTTINASMYIGGRIVTLVTPTCVRNLFA
jgi:hypothetical protein